MIHRIKVGFKKGVRDALGEKIKKGIIEDLNLPVLEVKTVDVYCLEAELTEKELNFLTEELFIDPIIQEFRLSQPFSNGVNWSIEIGLKPGVTDNVGRTAKEAIEALLKKKINGDIYTSKKYLISGLPASATRPNFKDVGGLQAGNLKKEDLEKIAKFLANELIQRWLIIKKGEKEKFLPIPKIKIPHQPEIKLFSVNISDEDLLKISGERKLALNLEEMRAIKNYFSNPKVIKERKKFGLDERPTDAELEAIAQTWSEHCKHKLFNAKINYREAPKESKHPTGQAKRATRF